MQVRAHLAAAVVRPAGRRTTSFLAVNKAAVDEVRQQVDRGRQNIVTDGPFRLPAWDHDASARRSPRSTTGATPTRVKLERINGCMIITEGTTAVQAYEAGEIDIDGRACRRPRIAAAQGDPDAYEPVPGARHLLLRPQRQDHPGREPAPRDGDRDRSAGDHRATSPRPTSSRRRGFTPQGMPGFDDDQPRLAVAAGDGDIDEGEGSCMAKVANPKKDITLLHQQLAGPHRRSRSAVQAHVEKARPQRHASSSRSGRNSSSSSARRRDTSVDAYRLGWIGDYPDAHELPRALDVQLGQQQHELVRQDLRRALREGSATGRRQRRSGTRSTRQARGQALRPERRHADRADLLVHVRPAASGQNDEGLPERSTSSGPDRLHDRSKMVEHQATGHR